MTVLLATNKIQAHQSAHTWLRYSLQTKYRLTSQHSPSVSSYMNALLTTNKIQAHQSALTNSQLIHDCATRYKQNTGSPVSSYMTALLATNKIQAHQSALTTSQLIHDCATHYKQNTGSPVSTHQQSAHTWLCYSLQLRLTISVNIDHTTCSMQSDTYSPTDHLTAENTSNRSMNTVLLATINYITHFYPISLSSRLTISVNIDHTTCIMQSDTYSPTDHLTAENASNGHSILCNLVQSTTQRTSTSSHYFSTDHIGQHWPYHMYHAVRHILRPTI